VTPKLHILDVVYIVSNNKLVRTQTLVRSAIIQVDSACILHWHQQRYGKDIRKKVVVSKEEIEGEDAGEKEKKKNNHPKVLGCFCFKHEDLVICLY